MGYSDYSDIRNNIQYNSLSVIPNMTTVIEESKGEAKQEEAKLSNGNTREALIARLPIPGPGAPKLTEEQKVIRRSVKKFLKQYEEGLLEKLPELSPKLVDQAKRGNMQAFDQIHKIVGAYKKDAGTIVPIQINFNDDRNNFQ